MTEIKISVRDIVRIDADKCTGCGVCLEACRQGAVELVQGKAVLISVTMCDGCGDCFTACPVGAALHAVDKVLPYSEVDVLDGVAFRGMTAVTSHLQHLIDVEKMDLLNEALEYLTEHESELGFDPMLCLNDLKDTVRPMRGTATKSSCSCGCVAGEKEEGCECVCHLRLDTPSLIAMIMKQKTPPPAIKSRALSPCLRQPPPMSPQRRGLLSPPLSPKPQSPMPVRPQVTLESGAAQVKSLANAASPPVITVNGVATVTSANQQQQLAVSMKWPVKLQLIDPSEPHFRGSSLLIFADCAALALGAFYPSLLQGKTLVMVCPKFDASKELQSKVVALIDEANVSAITVARLEVPCCEGLVQFVHSARAAAKRNIPVKVITVSGQGQIIGNCWT